MNELLLTNLPNCILSHIFNVVCNDDLRMYNKLIQLNKQYKNMVLMNVYVHNMMYNNINSKNTKMMNFLKKNSNKIKYLCIDNLEYISNISELKNIEHLVVTADYNKSTFSYIHKYNNIKMLWVNMGVDDNYMPIISFPNTLEELHIFGKMTLNVKHNIENTFTNNKCKIKLYKCGYNNYQENNEKCEKETEIFHETCLLMEKKMTRIKNKKRSYENYEKLMNIEFNNFRDYYDVENYNYEKQYDYYDSGDYNLCLYK